MKIKMKYEHECFRINNEWFYGKLEVSRSKQVNEPSILNRNHAVKQHTIKYKHRVKQNMRKQNPFNGSINDKSTSTRRWTRIQMKAFNV